MNENLTTIHAARRPVALLAAILGVFLAGAVLLSGASPASANIGFPADPGETIEQPDDAKPGVKRKEVMRLARREVSRKVRENGSDNVPRYRKGKGQIAPYSIGRGNAWCAAFSTWIWGRAGFDDFRSREPSPEHLWDSFSGEQVAVQVEALRKWAKRTKRHTVYATEGDLVAYGTEHVGIVMKVNDDPERRAIRAIEGNKGDRVRWVTIPMEAVIDYFSPVPISPKQRATRSILRPHVG